MYGGPSQVDTFDPKPALNEWAGKTIPAYRKEDSFFTNENQAHRFSLAVFLPAIRPVRNVDLGKVSAPFQAR